MANPTTLDISKAWATIQNLANNPDNLKSHWCVPPEAGRFLYLMTRIQNAKRVVEVGTSIGFSTLHLALGVAENTQNDKQAGEVISIDASAERQAKAQANFQESGLTEWITLKTGSALDVLNENAGNWENSLDVAFIDARKDEYRQYTDILYRCLRSGGLLIADNTQSHRKEMQTFIDFILREDRQGQHLWDSCDLDTPNGFIIARKR